MDRETGRSKGFGFVEFASDAEAKAAIAELDGKEVGGRALKVNEARPRNDFGGGGGGGRGGGGDAAAAETGIVAAAAAAAGGAKRSLPAAFARLISMFVFSGRPIFRGRPSFPNLPGYPSHEPTLP